MAEDHSHNPLSHVVDHATIEIPVVGGEIPLPKLGGVQVTRFMVMELLAALLIALLVVPLVARIRRQRVSKGRGLHLFESIALFIRDGIARPAIDGGHSDHGDDHGHGESGHDHGKPARRTSDAFLPFLWTLFFFVLFCNLLGMLPGGASATGNINVTGVLALMTFGVVLLAGMRTSGPVRFWTSLVPSMDVPPVMKPILWPLMFVIEVAGLLIRHAVLAVRLFANMLAGHLVIAVILGFITMAAGTTTLLVTPASLLGAVAISILELFVAFLQAYIFTFLAALFIGTAVHPH